MNEENHPNQVAALRRKRIGIFGGSFDPVHEGHIYLATLAKAAAELDEVWFLPCQISPHKLATPPSSGRERVEALQLAIRDLPWARVDQTEVEIDGPSYSYQTLKKLNDKFPGHEWFWIMGGDQWTMLSKWMHPEKLAELASFIVMARNGTAVYPMEGYRMQAVTGEHPASATKIRESLAKKESNIPYLDPEVARLIRSRQVDL
ncbi:MAG: nicotinate (nicotinamide) nucleotide adenylyltransferase [Verrucomicrobiota bacterium]